MKMANEKGEAVYYNSVEKNGKLFFIIKGLDGTKVIGRDRQRKASRSFTQEAQARAYLDRHGFRVV